MDLLFSRKLSLWTSSSKLSLWTSPSNFYFLSIGQHVFFYMPNIRTERETEEAAENQTD